VAARQAVTVHKSDERARLNAYGRELEAMMKALGWTSKARSPCPPCAPDGDCAIVLVV